VCADSGAFYSVKLASITVIPYGTGIGKEKRVGDRNEYRALRSNKYGGRSSVRRRGIESLIPLEG
jgi:hypothetical protein